MKVPCAIAAAIGLLLASTPVSDACTYPHAPAANMRSVPAGAEFATRVSVRRVWRGKRYGEPIVATVTMTRAYGASTRRWKIGKLQFYSPLCGASATPLVPGADLVIYSAKPLRPEDGVVWWTTYLNARTFDPKTR